MNKQVLSVFSVILLITATLLFPYNVAQVYASEHPQVQQNPAQRESQQQLNMCGNGAINIKDSFVLSAITLCLPGVIERTYEAQEINCQRVVCKYEAIINRLDPALCDSVHAYQKCVFVAGEGYELMKAFIPFAAFADNVRQMISNLLANPKGVLLGVATQLMRNRLSECAPGCDVSSDTWMVFVLVPIDLAGLNEYIKDLRERGVSNLPDENNYCEQMGKIEEDIEELLDAYTGEEEEDE